MLEDREDYNRLISGNYIDSSVVEDQSSMDRRAMWCFLMQTNYRVLLYMGPQ